MLNHGNAMGTVSLLTPTPPSPKGAQSHTANLIITQPLAANPIVITMVPSITQVSICESTVIT